MIRLGAPALLAMITVGGCDFFKELESLPGAEDEGEVGDVDTGTAGETGSEPCTVLDESCPNQDTLRYCDATLGELVDLDCMGGCLAAGQYNFTCTPTADFSHGCWCVNPGDIKLDSCAELETCVIECGGDPQSDCVHACFTRTDAQTIRLLGTLYSCADRACDDLCVSSPADCGSCLLAARAGLWGDCGVEREVCNSDDNGEPSWP